MKTQSNIELPVDTTLADLNIGDEAIFRKTIDHIKNDFTFDTPVSVKRSRLFRAGVPIELVDKLFPAPQNHQTQATKHFIRGIMAAVDKLSDLGEHHASEKLRSAFAKTLGESK